MRIFISYKRGVEPDESLALAVFQALSQQHKVFIDQESMEVGDRWAERIETEIRQADFFIVFLSEASVQSDMVKGEIEIAYNLAREQSDHPKILPVRVAYQAALPYPLNSYLNGINWIMWQALPDTSCLIRELQQKIPGSIFNINSIRKSTKVPKLLPYLPDRQPQERRLNQLLKTFFQKDNHKPLVCILHGDKSQGHDTFLERTREVFLPSRFRPDERCPIKKYSIRFPKGINKKDDFHEQLRNTLATAITNYAFDSIQEINNCISVRIQV
ncbi:MAG: TIR domain-containing protein [Cyanobacteria bacterium P01_F01_bin.143]